MNCKECGSCKKYVEHEETKEIITTNFDNIKSMDMIEMSKFLISNWFANDVCKNCEYQYDKCGNLEFCTSEILKWLSNNADIKGENMNIYKEIKQIAKLNEQRYSLVKKLEKDGFDIDGLDLELSYFVNGCIEKNGHLYDENGRRLDNCGLVDNDYYCSQYVGYLGDDFHGTLYYATNEKGVFVAIPFEM